MILNVRGATGAVVGTLVVKHLSALRGLAFDKASLSWSAWRRKAAAEGETGERGCF